MREQQRDNDFKRFIGNQGFDEASYYNDEVYEVDDSVDDVELRDRIVAVLNRDRILGLAEIEVQVSVGVVTISGDVPGTDERKRASDLILDLSGVRAVINLLSC